MIFGLKKEGKEEFDNGDVTLKVLFIFENEIYTEEINFNFDMTIFQSLFLSLKLFFL